MISGPYGTAASLGTYRGTLTLRKSRSLPSGPSANLLQTRASNTANGGHDWVTLCGVRNPFKALRTRRTSQRQKPTCTSQDLPTLHAFALDTSGPKGYPKIKAINHEPMNQAGMAPLSGTLGV